MPIVNMVKCSYFIEIQWNLYIKITIGTAELWFLWTSSLHVYTDSIMSKLCTLGYIKSRAGGPVVTDT